ncbi:unnamed protein product [Rhodiola kirilowii]
MGCKHLRGLPFDLNFLPILTCISCSTCWLSESTMCLEPVNSNMELKCGSLTS